MLLDSGEWRIRHDGVVTSTSPTGGQPDWLNRTIPWTATHATSTQALGCWWKIKIHNEGQAHDRTTWAARITGNPLRLVP